MVGAISCLGIFLNQVRAQNESAYLSFGNPSSQPTVGKNFSLPIIIDTANQKVAGADAVIRYDPQALAVVMVNPGEIFDTYPRHSYDLTGNIQLSGAMSATTASFSGRGTFGTLTFRPNQAGSTTLSFNCTEGQFNDSNILQALTNLDIIDCQKTSATTLLIAAAPTPVGQPSASPSASPSPLGKTGSFETTLIFAGTGLALILTGGLLRWKRRL